MVHIRMLLTLAQPYVHELELGTHGSACGVR
jgi:hypothetical protein